MHVGYLLFELTGLCKVRNLYLKWKNSLGGISVCHKYSIIAQMKMKMKIRVTTTTIAAAMTTTMTGGIVKCTAQPLSRNDRDYWLRNRRLYFCKNKPT